MNAVSKITGYYQLIESADGRFMFTLRAGNHETIFTSTVFHTRQAALDSVAEVRQASQDPANYERRRSGGEGTHFVLRNAAGTVLGRSENYQASSALIASMGSVQRNAPATRFKGLVRVATLKG
jgi:uncharacterized protein